MNQAARRPYMDEIIGKKVQIHLFDYRVLSEILPFKGPFLSRMAGHDDYGLWVEPDELVQEKREGPLVLEFPMRIAIRWNFIKSIVFLGDGRVAGEAGGDKAEQREEGQEKP